MVLAKWSQLGEKMAIGVPVITVIPKIQLLL
jgi:hypothetical protein